MAIKVFCDENWHQRDVVIRNKACKLGGSAASRLDAIVKHLKPGDVAFVCSSGYHANVRFLENLAKQKVDVHDPLTGKRN